MSFRDPGTGLLADALELLREADRMHRQFFTVPLGRPVPAFEPPIDMVERRGVLLIRVALPGVLPGSVDVATDGVHIQVVAVRKLDAGPGDTIHRLEIPHGRFERRIDLPVGRFELAGRELVGGCLLLQLRRVD
jgi:HSP20 family molecular chaperone IbpA